MAVAMARSYDQLCPVALSLDMLGDRWTVPLLRDLLWHGPQRFNEMLEPNPGLSPALLSQRLARLIDEGLVERIEAGGGAHYRLTSPDRRVEPLIAALYDFGTPLLTEASLSDGMIAYIFRRAARDNGHRLWDIPRAAKLSLVVGDTRVDLEAGPGMLRVVAEPDHDPALRMRMSRAAFIELATGRRSLAAAIEDATAQVEGDRDLAEAIMALL